MTICYPVIDQIATGENIRKLRLERKLTVTDLQDFCLVSSQAISKWQNGQSLPSTDNLVALSVLFRTTIEDILVFKVDSMKETPRDNSRGVLFVKKVFYAFWIYNALYTFNCLLHDRICSF